MVISPSPVSTTGPGRRVGDQYRSSTSFRVYQGADMVSSPPPTELLSLTEIHGQGKGLGSLGSPFSPPGGKAPCEVLITPLTTHLLESESEPDLELWPQVILPNCNF